MVNLKNESPYSYIISSGSDGIYYSQDGLTGKVVYSGSDAGAIFSSSANAAIAKVKGGSIFIKGATYECSTIPFSLNYIGTNKALRIEGENPQVIIQHSAGTLNYLVYYSTGSWLLGTGEPKIIIKNIKFLHKTFSANSSCIYLNHLICDLENIICYNTNTTVQGIGIDCEAPGANSAHGRWSNVLVSYYDTGIKMSYDHMVLEDIAVAYPKTEGIRIHWCAWITIINPTIYYVSNVACYSFVFTGTARFITIINPVVEGNISGSIFEDYGTAYTGRKLVLNLAGENSTQSVFGDNFTATRVKIIGTATGYLMSNYGYALVANGGTIAHGLLKTPIQVSLTASGSNPLQFSYIPDATNITVYHTAGGSAGVFWRAEV